MPATATPLKTSHRPTASAQQAPEGLFQFLDHSHQDMRRMLLNLRSLVDAIEAQGLTPAVRASIREVFDWFNSQAREHHLDEERHVFPALLASSVEATREIAERLVQDHGWLEADWIQIAPWLSAAIDGYAWFEIDTLRHAVTVFDQLYLDHMVLEESLAYPQARSLMATADLRAVAAEMEQRRDVRNARLESRRA